MATMLPNSFTNLLLLLIASHSLPGTAWLIEQYATLTVLPMVGKDRTEPIPVTSTAPLPSTVTPISTITTFGKDSVTAIDDYGYAALNVTTEYMILPNRTDLPLSTIDSWGQSSSTSEPEPTISTNYYLPLTISNLPSCTQTEYTYTESVEVWLPSTLTAQATDGSLAMFVTTYTSTISTNLGGQPVTATVCDVYLRGDAVPGAQEGFVDDYYLTECVDPRHSTCSGGQNTEATGSGGCNGMYPPTGAAQATTGGIEDGPTPTGGAASRRVQSGWRLGYISFFVYLLGFVV